jgi:hypothetical protein
LTALYWGAPSLFCFVLYWYGLRAQFQMDDFAWLKLHSSVHDVPGLLKALFEPLAQGTIRPWSERLFFLLGWHLFGLDAGPLRAVVFLTQFGNLILLTAITTRLTGSALAGIAAPLLWLCNSSLYIPLSWTSAYNQIQCAFFLLLAFWLWMRYTETGQTRFYAAQWVVFLLGFGALEINVVYPALAALHAFLFARKYLIRTVPMFVVSVLYAVVDRALAPPQSSDIYRMYFDWSIFHTLGTYVRWTFGIDRFGFPLPSQVLPHYAIEALVGGTLLAFIVVMAVRRHWTGLFGAGWFLVALAPVLPLRNHISDYYLTIPAIGLAIAGGWAISIAVSRGPAAKAAAVILVLLYALPSAWMGRRMSHEYHTISHRVQTFIGSVAFAHRLHPDKILLIRNVDNDLFWAVWWDNPFQLFGRKRIYASEECEPDIVPFPGFGTLARFILPQGEALEGMRRGEVVTYDLMSSGRLRNTTVLYREMLEHDSSLPMPKYLDLGLSVSKPYLGDGWWQAEGNFRWTSHRATLRMRGPSGPGGELVVRGLCPRQQVADGPLRLITTAGGHRFPTSTITEDNLSFEFRYPLPADLVRRTEVELTLEPERTFRAPGDTRDLGVAVGTVEIIP